MGRTRDALRAAVGAVAEAAMPHLGREIDEGRNAGRAAKLKRAIVLARLRRAGARGDGAAVERALAAFWRSASGDAFHRDCAEARYEAFHAGHAGVIEALDAYVAASGGGFQRLVEIGCGDGAVLAWCAGRLAWATEAVGLDVNAAVIARASAGQSADGPFAFACADARQWLAAHPQAGTVVISNGGVLKYLAPETFDALLAALASAAPAAIALVEPIDRGHDLAARPDSYVFGAKDAFLGAEKVFSHNHRHRLERAGFEVVFAEEAPLFGGRGVMMVGVRR